MPRHHLDIQTTLTVEFTELASALEPIVVMTIASVTETLKSVINEMTHGTNFKLVNVLDAENAKLTHEDLNSSIDKAESRWNIHHVSYDN